MEKKENKFQVRLHLSEEFAKAARETPYAEKLAPLSDVMKQHNVTLTCQYDEFRNFVAAAEAHGEGNSPLTSWTRNTINDPVKEAKYKKVFIVNVGGDQLFSRDKAAELIEAFQTVRPDIVEKIIRPSDDPAHNPQPPRPKH